MPYVVCAEAPTKSAEMASIDDSNLNMMVVYMAIASETKELERLLGGVARDEAESSKCGKR